METAWTNHRTHDRAIHASLSVLPTGLNAIAFCVILAISGLVMAFGKFFLLPMHRNHLVWLADLCALKNSAQLCRDRCSPCHSLL